MKRADRALARAWYGGMLGGLLPILLLGFLYSALADRTVFVLWALVAATGWVVVLRAGLQNGWPRSRRIAALALWLALALAGFALLETRHHEILDLGFRAVFYGVYHPYATAPRTAWILAGLAALLAVISFTIPSSRLPPRKPPPLAPRRSGPPPLAPPPQSGRGEEGGDEGRPPSPAPLGRGKGGGVP